MLYYHLRRCGEIGRRAGLKILWSKIRVGSSPTTGTNEKEQPQAAVLCISSPRGVSADAVTCARAKVGERGGKSGAAAKCKEKPREVFASADRGICAPHKPTGTSCPLQTEVSATRDPAKCRRNIVGNKPREVFASADRGICAQHKPTGTSCIYVILLQPHTGAENAKISFGNRLTRVKRGYIIQSVESEISFFSVVKFAYANRCERESGNQSVSTVAKRHLFLRK